MNIDVIGEHLVPLFRQMLLLTGIHQINITKMYCSNGNNLHKSIVHENVSNIVICLIRDKGPLSPLMRLLSLLTTEVPGYMLPIAVYGESRGRKRELQREIHTETLQ